MSCPYQTDRRSQPEKLNDLNVIHITGTKGKGSTSAFADSIIRHAKPDWKVGMLRLSHCLGTRLNYFSGLYTSPHLVAVRERIRINGEPIAEELFAKYFFEIWERLQSNTTVSLWRPLPHHYVLLTFQEGP